MASHLKHKPELWRSNCRVLAIDHGTKTFGLAVSNTEQTMVIPLSTVHRKKWNLDKHILGEILMSYDIEQIVIGYPLNRNGTKNPRCQSVKDFSSLMEQEWPDIPIFFWDERLSTDAVDKILDNNHAMRKDKRKQFKDALAAQIILEEVLNMMKSA